MLRLKERQPELLASSGASVFFLQEVTRDFDSDPSGPAQERLLLKNLRERSFTIVRTGENKETSRSDTAIAIDSNAFSDIEDHSQEIQYVDVAIATAIDKKSGKKVLFISATLLGWFNQKSRSDTRENGRSCCIGDKQAAAIMAQIQEQFQDCEIQIVGADMNSNQKLGEASPNRVGGLDTVVNPYTEIGKKRF